jgi:uncharacterized delta-60 repeat protein
MHSSLPTQRSGLERLRHVARPVMAVATGLMVAALATGCGGNDLLAGSLDKQFGKASDGIVSLSLGIGNDSAKAMAVQADGKIIVAGTSTSTGGSTSNIVIERFNNDGTPDETFGTKGLVNLDLDTPLSTSSDDAKAVAIQADGKIVVAGNSTPTGGSSNVVLARLDKNGKLDATFGADGNADGTPDGVVQVSFGNGDDAVDAIAIQQDGKIVVAGDTTSNTGGSQNMMVARLNIDGTPDKTFGADSGADGTPDGVVSISLGDGNDEAKAVAIQADGRIVIAGNTVGADNTSNIVVARLNSDGTLDTTNFGVGNADNTPNGVVAVSLSNGDDKAKAVALQADGKILVGGVTVAADKSSNVAVARLNSDGTLDASFGAGSSDGTPDGSVSVSFGAGDDKLKGLVVQADGKILIAGSNTAADGSTNAVVARLNSNGALDSSFGEDSSDGTPNGVVSISLGSGDDSAEALALQADGKILIAGDHVASDGSSNIFVARLIN